MNKLVPRALTIAMLAMALAASLMTATVSFAQSPADVPWSNVPSELKEAIRTEATAIGARDGLSYSGACETGQRGQLCARVVVLEGETAKVAIGLFQSQAEFVTFVLSGGSWKSQPGAPATGSGAVALTSSDQPLGLYLAAGALVSISLLLGWLSQVAGSPRKRTS